MIRTLPVLLLVLFYPATRFPAASADEVIPQAAASVHGLLRPWSLQVDIDRSRSRVQSAILDRGVIFVQTDAAVVHAFDAETGRPIWNAPRLVGDPRHPTLPPAVSKNMLSVVNGSTLFVLNRQTGDLLWQTEVDGVPAIGPCMSDQTVLVPTINGVVLMYRLKPAQEAEAKPKAKQPPAAVQTVVAGPAVIRLAQDHKPPLACMSTGQLTGPPIMLTSTEDEDLLAWPTDQGALLIAAIQHNRTRFVVRYRFLAGTGTAAGLAYRPAEGQGPADAGLVYVASREGLVYAVSEKTGQSVWEFPAGDAVAEAPVVVGPNLYVANQLGGMFCLDAKTGAVRWSAPQVVKFLSAGPERVYAMDKLERLVSLEARTGSRLDEMDAHAFPLRLVNAQTDRIYLGTRQGLFQCLHDPRQTEALVYLVEPKHAEKKAEKEKPALKKPAEEAGAEEKPKPAKKSKRGKKGEEAPADPFAKPAKKK